MNGNCSLSCTSCLYYGIESLPAILPPPVDDLMPIGRAKASDHIRRQCLIVTHDCYCTYFPLHRGQSQSCGPHHTLRLCMASSGNPGLYFIHARMKSPLTSSSTDAHLLRRQFSTTPRLENRHTLTHTADIRFVGQTPFPTKFQDRLIRMLDTLLQHKSLWNAQMFFHNHRKMHMLYVPISVPNSLPINFTDS